MRLMLFPLSWLLLALSLGVLAFDPAAVCTFNDPAFSGTITLESLTSSTTRFDLSLSGSQVSTNVWEIREYSTVMGCSAAGPVMLSGTLPVGTQFVVNNVQVPALVGRSIVVMTPGPSSTTVLTCCDILVARADIQGGNPNYPILRQRNAPVTCALFPADNGPSVRFNVSGSISLRSFYMHDASYVPWGLRAPPTPIGTEIILNVTHDLNGPLPYHVHEYPMSRTGLCGAASTGGHYNPRDGLSYVDGGVSFELGELSNKHGGINSTVFHSYIDSGVPLDGPFGIGLRSIVLHDPISPATRVACCTVPPVLDPTPAYGVVPEIEAVCSLDADVTGYIHFEQPGPSGYGVQITVSTFFQIPTDRGVAHDWRIYTTSASTDPLICLSGGGNVLDFPWLRLGPDAQGTLRSGLLPPGMLGNKLGMIPGTMTSVMTVNDSAISLSGPNSILGRSLKIFRTATSTAQVSACCNIVMAPPGSTIPSPTSAVCDFGTGSGQPVLGLINLTQAYPTARTYFSAFLNGTNRVSSWRLNTYGSSGGCRSTGQAFNLSGQPAYFDLQGRLGPLTNTLSLSDEVVRIPDVVGRSIVLLNSNNSIIGCCTIRLTSQAEPTVRYTYSGAESTCSFSNDILGNQNSTDDVEGFIKIRELTAAGSPDLALGSEFEVSVIGSGLSSAAKALSINVNPYSGSCRATGVTYAPVNDSSVPPSHASRFSIGQLQNKHGSFVGTTAAFRFIDNGVRLTGPIGVAGRSIAIYDAVDPNLQYACCQIASVVYHPLYVPPLPRASRKAACIMSGQDVQGTFVFVETGNGVTIGTNPKGFWFSVPQLGAHDFQVHQFSGRDVNKTGPVFSPRDFVGPGENGISFSSTNLRMTAGDLSGKWGKLVNEQPFNSVADVQLSLAGPYSVLGRSVVVYSLTGLLLDYCTIEAVSDSFFAVDPDPLVTFISPCRPGDVFESFVCAQGIFIYNGDLSLAPDSTQSWKNFNFTVFGGVAVNTNTVLELINARTIVSYLRLAADSIVRWAAVEGSQIGSFHNNGGTFDATDGHVTITGSWDEPTCSGLPATPSPPPSPTPAGSPSFMPSSLPTTPSPVATPPPSDVNVSSGKKRTIEEEQLAQLTQLANDLSQAPAPPKPPVTVVNPNTQITIQGAFNPCGLLIVEAYASASFKPFIYGSRGSSFAEISVRDVDLDPCTSYSLTSSYGATELSITVDQVIAESCKIPPEALPLSIIIPVVVIGGLVILVLLIIFTPIGIPCRIWYRKTCSKQRGVSGRSTEGF